MKKRIIVIAIAATAAAAAGVGLAAHNLCSPVRALHATELSTGEKYLAELNYTKATATLQNVILVEPRNTEAYLALSKAYQYMGDLDMAKETLESGFGQTNSTVIERALRELLAFDTAAPDGPAAPDVEIIEIAGQSFRADITELVLRDCGLTDADMQKLSKFKSLERLDISGNGISDISAVANLTTLKKFYAANNAITDISALSGLQSLEYIGLRGNQITDADALFAINHLLYLHLSNNRITRVSSLGNHLQLFYAADNNIDDFTAVKSADLLYYDISGNPGM